MLRIIIITVTFVILVSIALVVYLIRLDIKDNADDLRRMEEAEKKNPGKTLSDK